MVGNHRTDDPQDPLLPGGRGWWSTAEDRAAVDEHRRRDDRTQQLPRAQVPVPLPRDQYDEVVSGEFPLPMNPGEMPTIDRHRPPMPVGPRTPADRPAAPTKKPSIAARIAHSTADWITRVGLLTAVAAFVAVVVAWCGSTSRAIDQLQKENRDLRQVQITQQRRLTQAEKDAASARDRSSEAKDDADQVAKRMDLLEDNDPQSGS